MTDESKQRHGIEGSNVTEVIHMHDINNDQGRGTRNGPSWRW